MNEATRNENRRRALNTIEIANRGRPNSVSFGLNETWEHAFSKFKVCWELMNDGDEFYTEVIFKDGKGRADIVNLSDCSIIEILHTETPEQFEEKRLKYPTEFTRIMGLKTSNIMKRHYENEEKMV